MGISQYLKDIGRGARGAKALTRAQAADLLGQILDGQVTDLEIGAFCLAMRIKGETADEMCGFLDATAARMAHMPTSNRPLVILPSYNGARKLSVRETENLIKHLGKPAPATPKTPAEKSRDLLRVEEELSDLLMAEVQVRVKKRIQRNGRIEEVGEISIGFASVEALNGLLERLRK